MSRHLVSMLVWVSVLSLGAEAAPKHKPGHGRGRRAAPTAKPAPAARPAAKLKPMRHLARKEGPVAARALGAAYDLIQNESADKNAAARKLCAPYLRDAVYGDEALWLTAQAHLNDARLSLEAAKFDRARASGEQAHASILQIEGRYPHSATLRSQSRDLAAAELMQANALTGLKKLREAQALYQTAFQRLMSAGSLAQAGHDELRGYAQSCQKFTGEFCEAWLSRLGPFWPKSSPEAKALLAVDPSLADAPRRPGAPAKATATYKAPDLDQAAFDAAFVLYLDEKYGDAIEALQKFAQEFPKSTYRFRARFWLARATEKKGRDEEAKKLYSALKSDSPLTFYGLLASLALSEPLGVPTDPSAPLASELDTALTPSEIYRLKKARAFVEVGAKELATQELHDFKARDPISSPFLMGLAQLNSRVENHATAFSLLSELILRGSDRIFTQPVFEMIFPVRFAEPIRKAALEQKIDPVLLLSLVKQESAFDPQVSSGSGALGLTQILYATALESFPTLERKDLDEPAPNLRAGAKYLAWLLRKFGGNTALALAAYNAGPTAADRWVKAQPKKLPLLEFLETIPYKESREYVAAILRNYYWYSKIQGAENTPKTLADLDRFWQ